MEKKKILKVDIARFEAIPLRILKKEETTKMMAACKDKCGYRRPLIHLPKVIEEGWLMIDLYHPEYSDEASMKKPGNYKFVGRVFVNKDEERYGVLKAELVWSQEDPERLTYPSYPGFIDDGEMVETGYFGKGEQLNEWLANIRMERKIKKEQANIILRDDDMSFIRPLTKAEQAFVDGGCFRASDELAIFDRSTGECRCTSCGKQIPIAGIKQNKISKCPECGAKVKGRSITGGVANQFATVLVIKPLKGGGAVFRYFSTSRNFDRGKIGWTVRSSEQGRTVEWPEGSGRHTTEQDYAYGDWLGERQWYPVKVLARGGYMTPGNVSLYGKLQIYTGNLSALKSTRYVHLVCPNLPKFVREYINGTEQTWAAEWFFKGAVPGSMTLFHKEYEPLLKIGWFNVLSGKVMYSSNGWYYYNNHMVSINTEKDSIIDMLGLAKEQYRGLGKNPEYGLLAHIQELNRQRGKLLSLLSGAVDKNGEYDANLVNSLIEVDKNSIVPVSCEELKDLKGKDISSENYTYLRCFMSHHKIMKYLETGPNTDMWKDYVEMCFKAGYKKSQISFFPRDLKKAHDNIMTEIQVKEDATRDRKLQLVAKAMQERYSFEKNGYSVSFLASTEQIREEAKQMDNCIFTHFLDEIANGQTAVMSIRKVDAPDKPVADLEIKEGRVKQLWGPHNSKPTREITTFVNKFFCKEKKVVPQSAAA